MEALLSGLDRKEAALRGQFDEIRNFMKSWMSLLAENLKDLEKNLISLARKFVRLEIKADKREKGS